MHVKESVQNINTLLNYYISISVHNSEEMQAIKEKILPLCTDSNTCCT